MGANDFPLTVSAGRQACWVQNPESLLSLFEGLGANCEFGNVQRASGFEPLGLFRFASLPYEHMLELLATRFKGIDDPALIDVRVIVSGNHDEWWGTIDRFGIRYHTHRSSRAVPVEVALADERLKMKYLKRKLLDDLDEPAKIFVRSDPQRTEDEMRAGFEALRRYGDHTLLWVLEAANPHLVGTVREIEPGLVLGYVKKFDAHAVPSLESIAVWHRLLVAAVENLKPELATELKAWNRTLPHGSIAAPQLWHAKSYAHSVVSVGIAPRQAEQPVAKHLIRTTTQFPDHILMSCGPCDLEPGAVYVFSLWVWIPQDFAGSINLVFPGSAALWNFGVDMEQRECWQRLVSSVRIPAHLTHHYPSLVAEAVAGQWFYSTEWRFERGAIPDPCDLAATELVAALPAMQPEPAA